ILCFSVAFSSLFFYYSTATSHTYTLSLHDALPILTTAHTCVDPRIFRLPIFSRESWLGSGVPGYLILLWGELVAPFFIGLGELIWHCVLREGDHQLDAHQVQFVSALVPLATGCGSA